MLPHHFGIVVGVDRLAASSPLSPIVVWSGMALMSQKKSKEADDSKGQEANMFNNVRFTKTRMGDV